MLHCPCCFSSEAMIVQRSNTCCGSLGNPEVEKKPNQHNKNVTGICYIKFFMDSSICPRSYVTGLYVTGGLDFGLQTLEEEGSHLGSHLRSEH